MKSAALVLATVNAPYSKQLSAQELVYYLLHPVAAKTVPGHMSAFFGEVPLELQLQFAHQNNVTDEQLVAAAKAFAAYSHESYPLAG